MAYKIVAIYDETGFTIDKKDPYNPNGQISA